MLGLLSDTDPRWIDAAQADLDGLLSDHAHCEIKAAQTGLSLMARYGGQYPYLVIELNDLVREESEHFQQVHEKLQQREQSLGIPQADDYVNSLRKCAAALTQASSPLLDRLLVSSLVEARSCERFRLLSEGLKDANLRTFYRSLMSSEARHYRLFRNLAERAFGRAEACARFEKLAEHESTIASSLPLGPTVHG